MAGRATCTLLAANYLTKRPVNEIIGNPSGTGAVRQIDVENISDSRTYQCAIHGPCTLPEGLAVIRRFAIVAKCPGLAGLDL